MQKLIIIGNLGTDAEVKVQAETGRKFVTFKVADSNKWTDIKGVVHESVMWISCILNGDGGNILQYLKRGTKVFVEGRPSYRVYSSQKDRAVKAGVDLTVNNIELCGGSSDDIPRQLVDADGTLVDVSKHYWCDGHNSQLLMGIHGGSYQVNVNGFITKIQEQEQEIPVQEAEAQPAEAEPQQQTTKKRTTKK